MPHPVKPMALTMSLLIAGCASYQQAMDQDRLRQHFNLSTDTKLLEYSSFPAEVIGPRAGLQIQAIYQLGDSAVTDIVENGQTAGWRSLPIPQKTLVKLPYNNAKGVTPINMPLTASEGMFLCKTVGDHVLSAPIDTATLCENQVGTLHCQERMTQNEAKTSDQCERRFGDQILGILDLETKQLSVFVGSTY